MFTDKTVLLEKALQRGYKVYSFSSNYSVYNLVNDEGIGLILHTVTEEFELYYNVDLITKLTIGRNGSFMMDKYFISKEERFKEYVRRLKGE